MNPNDNAEVILCARVVCVAGLILAVLMAGVACGATVTYQRVDALSQSRLLAVVKRIILHRCYNRWNYRVAGFTNETLRWFCYTMIDRNSPKKDEELYAPVYSRHCLQCPLCFSFFFACFCRRLRSFVSSRRSLDVFFRSTPRASRSL